MNEIREQLVLRVLVEGGVVVDALLRPYVGACKAPTQQPNTREVPLRPRFPKLSLEILLWNWEKTGDFRFLGPDFLLQLSLGPRGRWG